MRSIDADMLSIHIESEFEGVCVYDISGSQAAMDFCNIVDVAPTVKTIPVEWIKARWGDIIPHFSDRQWVEEWLIEDWQKEQEAK